MASWVPTNILLNDFEVLIYLLIKISVKMQINYNSCCLFVNQNMYVITYWLFYDQHVFHRVNFVR